MRGLLLASKHDKKYFEFLHHLFMGTNFFGDGYTSYYLTTVKQTTLEKFNNYVFLIASREGIEEINNFLKKIDDSNEIYLVYFKNINFNIGREDNQLVLKENSEKVIPFGKPTKAVYKNNLFKFYDVLSQTIKGNGSSITFSKLRKCYTKAEMEIFDIEKYYSHLEEINYQLKFEEAKDNFIKIYSNKEVTFKEKDGIVLSSYFENIYFVIFSNLLTFYNTYGYRNNDDFSKKKPYYNTIYSHSSSGSDFYKIKSKRFQILEKVLRKYLNGKNESLDKMFSNYMQEVLNSIVYINLIHYTKYLKSQNLDENQIIKKVRNYLKQLKETPVYERHLELLELYNYTSRIFKDQYSKEWRC